MAVPALSVSFLPAADAAADVLVLGVVSGEGGPRIAGDDPAFADISASLAAIGATGAADELRRLPGLAGGPAVALIGLGSGEPTSDALRNAAGAAIRQLAGTGSVALGLPVTGAADLTAVLEGAGIGAYAYDAYKTKAAPAKALARTVIAHAPSDLQGAPADWAVARATAVATATHTVRDLVNMPPSDLYPATLADAAIAAAEGLPVDIEVLDEVALAEGGYGGIAGVGAGSSRPPRLVTVRYAPDGATSHLSLVGKGITFDSGGLSLKPSGSMVGMKYDMTGAATVLAVVLAVARLGLAVRVTARLCIAENLPSGTAIRPNDVLTMRGGTTVEVLNTDAEGRLVLADGLVDASAEHPDALVDVATLTGAARSALGERYIPIMGGTDFVRRVTEVGATVGETFWPMPLPTELRSNLDSDVADMSNGRPSNPVGGMLVAGHFLEHFVGRVSEEADAPRIPWAHLDIAGTASNGGSPYGMLGKGATGVTVRTLIALADEYSRP